MLRLLHVQLGASRGRRAIVPGTERAVRDGAVCEHKSSASYVSCCNQATWGANRWPDGSPIYSRFQTVLPPNSPNCVAVDGTDSPNTGVIGSLSSQHPGGAIAAMADGSVRFISEQIDCGNLSSPEVSSGPSPYGVWGALGTKDGGEGKNNYVGR